MFLGNFIYFFVLLLAVGLHSVWTEKFLAEAALKGDFESVALTVASINCIGLHFSDLPHCLPCDSCNAHSRAKYLQSSLFPPFWLVHTPLRSVHTKPKEAISLRVSEYKKAWDLQNLPAKFFVQLQNTLCCFWLWFRG